jgi:hypothetical protein
MVAEVQRWLRQPSTRYFTTYTNWLILTKKEVITLCYMIYGVSAVLAKALNLAKATRRNYQVTGRQDGAGV